MFAVEVVLHEIVADLPAGTSKPLHGGTAWWFAPGRALLLGGTPPGDAIDQTGGFTLLRLDDAEAAHLLPRICRLDLHGLAPGSVARTPMAQVPAILYRADTHVDILVPSTLAHSFARHCRHILAQRESS